MAFPQITTDDDGVWCVPESGSRHGIRWNELCRIGGYKLDTINRVDTVIELDFEYGEFIELNSEFPGFDAAIRTFSIHVPSLAQNWFSQIENLNAGDKGVTVWERTEQEM